MSIRVIKFETRYRKNQKGKDEPVDWVLVAPRGENSKSTQTWHRVEKLRPVEGLSDREKEGLTHVDMRAKWSIIGPAYEAYAKGIEIPEDGTPLASWSAITPSLAKVLKGYGLTTVEHIAEMGDAMVSKVPFPDARKLPGMAKDYLEGKGASELAAQNAALQERIAAMEEMLESATKPKKQAKAA